VTTDVRLRPIAESELATFAATATDPAHAEAVHRYVDDLLARGAMRRDWCFLAEWNGAPVARIAFWTLPGATIPSDIVLFDLPWSAPEAEAFGASMLRRVADRARSLGVGALGHVLDTPQQAPQWQAEPERRRALLTASGFEIRRETVRFELDPGTPVPPPAGELVFRSMAEVGKAAFRAATDRVSEGTLDRRIGDEDIFADAQGLQHEPGWWELAYDPDGALVGLVMPALGDDRLCRRGAGAAGAGPCPCAAGARHGDAGAHRPLAGQSGCRHPQHADGRRLPPGRLARIRHPHRVRAAAGGLRLPLSSEAGARSSRWRSSHRGIAGSGRCRPPPPGSRRRHTCRPRSAGPLPRNSAARRCPAIR
jgi:hypothetical protein